MPLSVKQVEAAKPIWDKAKQKWRENRLADGEQLYLVAQKREKTWRMRYYYGGVERNLTIGHFPEMTLAEARQKNRYYRGKLDEGHDPAEVMKREKGAIVAAVMEERRIAKGESHPDSFGAIAEDWLSDVKKGWKPRTFTAEAKRVRKHLIEPLGHLLIKDVKAHEHIRPLFQRLEEAGKYTTLKKIAEKTVSIFNFAIALGKCENNPAYSIWKGLSFTRPSKSNSFPSITDSEKIGQLLLDIDNYAAHATTVQKTRRSVEVCYAAKIMPYVFLRPSHLVEGKWAEINWKAKQWCIPGERMKNGKDFVVPLSRQVLALLKELQGYTGEHDYIFPSQVAGTGHITIETVNKVFSRIGYKNKMCGHGWRHAFVTNCKEKLHYSSDVIYKQMSHTLEKDAAKATYDKAEFLPERTAMMQDYADFLDGLKAAAQPGAGKKPSIPATDTPQDRGQEAKAA